MINRIAVVGATGLVGQAFIDLIKERDFSYESFHPFASEKSEGEKLIIDGRSWAIESLKEGSFKEIDLAFFSAGGAISQKWAPQAQKESCIVIDNSSVFRMQKDIPLIVPEVNASILTSKDRLIANPNCSTIQLCIALNPIHKEFCLERVHVATYQSLSGAGTRAVDNLKKETSKVIADNSYKSNQAFNCIPQIGDIAANGLSLEDTKVQEETKKILNIPELFISAFSVRVPTLVSHGEVVWVKLKKPPSNREQFIQALSEQTGLHVMEGQDQYPINQTTSGKNDVYIGRIHQDEQDPSTWMMWIAADNLRKGAALNGIQVAEFLKTNLFK